MKENLILAGVGGQGILTIAQVISSAVLSEGLNLKQAEVHGMAQRGGGVQAHIRLSDQPIYSDVIADGQAHLILSVEPMEALRYLSSLRADGRIITSIKPYINIKDYPPIEDILGRLRAHPRHILLDADRIAKLAGSARAANMVMLGAALSSLQLNAKALEEAMNAFFKRKGKRIIGINQRALSYGSKVARHYVEGLAAGRPSETLLEEINNLSKEDLNNTEVL